MNINFQGDYALVLCPNPAVDIYAWIEGFTIGSSNRIVKEERYPGGKGVHVAMALEELGVPTVLLGFWGSVTGEWIKKACMDYYPSIKIDGITLSQWSRSCYTFKSNDDFDDTEILGGGPNLKKNDLESFTEKYESYLDKAKIVAMCGSWPMGAPSDSYQNLIKLANKHSIPTVLDCTGVQLKNALKENPFLLHLNRKEILEYTNTTSLIAAEKDIKSNCLNAAITDGKNGLYLSNKNGRNHSVVKIDKVYSSIGSGDCLVAGLIAGYIKGGTIQEIANMGAACGAANCINSNLGMLKHEDVNLLMQEARSSF